MEEYCRNHNIDFENSALENLSVSSRKSDNIRIKSNSAQKLNVKEITNRSRSNSVNSRSPKKKEKVEKYSKNEKNEKIEKDEKNENSEKTINKSASSFNKNIDKYLSGKNNRIIDNNKENNNNVNIKSNNYNNDKEEVSLGKRGANSVLRELTYVDLYEYQLEVKKMIIKMDRVPKKVALQTVNGFLGFVDFVIADHERKLMENFA